MICHLFKNKRKNQSSGEDKQYQSKSHRKIKSGSDQRDQIFVEKTNYCSNCGVSLLNEREHVEYCPYCGISVE